MNDSKNSAVLLLLAMVFLVLAVAFARHHTMAPRGESIPLVDPSLVAPTTFRTSYLQLIRAKADLSDFDCYACHEKGKPPVIKYDTNHNIIIPKEHEDVVMKHGTHNRNNVCFNCHDEQNLSLLQTRDGHEVKLEDSPRLCGSCHGPTYRDWEAGAHGRTGGNWNPQSAEFTRQICVDCHNPHSPKIPGRKPLPPPHLLHPVAAVEQGRSARFRAVLKAKAQRGKDAMHLSGAPVSWGATERWSAITAQLLRDPFASLLLCASALNSGCIVPAPGKETYES
jgi:hypothetical protein